MRIPFFLGVLFETLLVQADTDFDRQEIQQRIGPVGHVRVQGDNSQSAAITTEKPKPVAPKSKGQEIYDQYCHVCHQAGIAGAPKFRVKADWAPRLSQKDMNGLITTVNKGFIAMPPKGACSTCTDEDIKAAILYMESEK